MENVPNHYETLGVLPDSEDAIVKSAYRALMQKFHPDTFPGDRAVAERKSKEINGAYEILGNPESRKRYDAERHTKNPPALVIPSSPPFSHNRSSPGRPPPDHLSARGWAFLVLIVFLAVVGALVGVAMRGGQLSVAASDAPSDGLKTPALISWQTDGSRKNYRAGDLLITMFALPNPVSTNQTPVMVVKAHGLPPVEVQGQERFQTAMASILVMRLDPMSAANEVVLATSSGDAHCCTQLTILERWKGKWKRIDAGSWDGDVLSNLPQDIDGDKVPDFVFTDENFNNAFASYAESHPPPVIFNLIDGVYTNVSREPRYIDFYIREMTTDEASCLLHRNGACAAFVAIANRLDLHDWAWRYMLANYDRNDTWPLPESCDVPGNTCPAGSNTPDYPDSLAAFLAQHGYEGTNANGVQRPSFPCADVKTPVLRLICSSPVLAEADRDLAGAYLAAVSTASQPSSLRDDQQKWISWRNNLRSPGIAQLKRLYDHRTEELTELARLGAE